MFKPGGHAIFPPGHIAVATLYSSGQTVLCVGHNNPPRWGMHDRTARVKLYGEPIDQMARIATFSEEVVCPA